VTIGTVESAPARFRGGRVVLLTTVISTLLYVGYYVASAYFGVGIGDIPVIVPTFE
jgi:predicted secreted protein